MSEKIETVIVGGGQAGLSLSYYLTQAGRDHMVLEKAALAGNVWRNMRWDSFTLVTPNWAFKLPGAEYQGDKPGGFMSRVEIVRRFEQYGEQYHLPVTYNTDVDSVASLDGGGYLVTAGGWRIQAKNVVIATGLPQKDKTLPSAAEIPADIQQVVSSQYRNPDSLPPGAVVVIGSAQSGCQIAEELAQNGRSVYLATGKVGWVPRWYRGRDGVEWVKIIGFYDRTVDVLPSPQMRFVGNPSLTGKDGGHTLNLHTLQKQGVTLLGRFQGIQDNKLLFAQDLKENIAFSDQKAKDMYKMFDQAIQKLGISAPEEDTPFPNDAYNAHEILELDLASAGISTIIWARGYSFDFSLVKLPVVDEVGFPVTQNGVTRFPGLYFIGMPWISKYKSGFLIGVGEDAAFLAGQITSRM